MNSAPFAVRRVKVTQTHEPVLKSVKCKLWRFEFPFGFIVDAITQPARTKSEARAILKGKLGVIPPHTKSRSIGECNVMMQTRIDKHRVEQEMAA